MGGDPAPLDSRILICRPYSSAPRATVIFLLFSVMEIIVAACASGRKGLHYWQRPWWCGKRVSLSVSGRMGMIFVFVLSVWIS